MEASQICQDTAFDFYLYSYAGIQVGCPCPITELCLLFWSVLIQCSVTWL